MSNAKNQLLAINIALRVAAALLPLGASLYPQAYSIERISWVKDGDLRRYKRIRVTALNERWITVDVCMREDKLHALRIYTLENGNILERTYEAQALWSLFTASPRHTPNGTPYNNWFPDPLLDKKGFERYVLETASDESRQQATSRVMEPSQRPLAG